jgi:hypothetical protein
MYSTRFLSLGAPLVAGLWMGGDRPIIVLFSLLAAVALLLAVRHLQFSLRDATAGIGPRCRDMNSQDV